MEVVVRLPGPLRDYAGGAARVALALPDGAPTTVATVLDLLAQRHPAVDWRVRDERGALRRHVNVFIGMVDARESGGLAADVPDGEEVTILPAVSGG